MCLVKGFRKGKVLLLETAAKLSQIPGWRAGNSWKGKGVIPRNGGGRAWKERGGSLVSLALFSPQGSLIWQPEIWWLVRQTIKLESCFFSYNSWNKQVGVAWSAWSLKPNLKRVEGKGGKRNLRLDMTPELQVQHSFCPLVLTVLLFVLFCFDVEEGLAVWSSLALKAPSFCLFSSTENYSWVLAFSLLSVKLLRLLLIIV